MGMFGDEFVNYHVLSLNLVFHEGMGPLTLGYRCLLDKYFWKIDQ